MHSIWLWSVSGYISVPVCAGRTASDTNALLDSIKPVAFCVSAGIFLERDLKVYEFAGNAFTLYLLGFFDGGTQVPSPNLCDLYIFGMVFTGKRIGHL